MLGPNCQQGSTSNIFLSLPPYLSSPQNRKYTHNIQSMACLSLHKIDPHYVEGKTVWGKMEIDSIKEWCWFNKGKRATDGKDWQCRPERQRQNRELGRKMKLELYRQTGVQAETVRWGEEAEKNRYGLRWEEPRRQNDMHARQALSLSHHFDTTTPQVTAKHMGPVCLHNGLL